MLCSVEHEPSLACKKVLKLVLPNGYLRIMAFEIRLPPWVSPWAFVYTWAHIYLEPDRTHVSVRVFGHSYIHISTPNISTLKQALPVICRQTEDWWTKKSRFLGHRLNGIMIGLWREYIWYVFFFPPSPS